MSAIAACTAQGDRSMQRLAAWFSCLFVVLTVAESIDLKFSEHYKTENEIALEDATDSGIESVEQGSLSRRLGLLALAALGAISLRCPSDRRLKIQGALGLSILVFLGWSAASLAWSGAPAMTLRKITAFACLAIGALGVAKALSWRQWIAFVFCATGVYLLLGLGAELVLGNFRPLAGGYQFTGLSYPAFTAWTFSLLVLAGATLRAPAGWRRAGILTLLCVALPLLFLARSRTPAAAFLVAASVFTVLVWPLGRTFVASTILVVALSSTLFVNEILSGNSFTAVADVVNLGREKESISDLTGRTEVWQELTPYIQARPWLGYGYESFWTPPRLLQFASSQRWAVPDAHNGFINLTLGVGLVGSCLYTLCLGLALLRAVRSSVVSHRAEFAFVTAALVAHGLNMLCIANQMAPYLPSFVSLVLFAKLGFVDERSPEPPRGDAATGDRDAARNDKNQDV